MKRIASIVGMVALGAGLLWAAHEAGGEVDHLAWFNQHKNQLRRILNMPPQIGLDFVYRRPSRFPGFDELKLVIIRDETRQELQLHISSDGQKVVYDREYDLVDPFGEILKVIKLNNSPAIGPEDALVTIVKYSDYTCTFCRRFFETMQEPLLERYQGRVRFVHKLFPAIGYRQNAQETSVAAACAFRQGNDSFWALHGRMFANMKNFSQGRPLLLKLARQSKLDLPGFEKCLDQQDALLDVARDQEEGIRLGIDGTPTFFVNGRPIAGMPTAEFFYYIIDEELALQEKN